MPGGSTEGGSIMGLPYMDEATAAAAVAADRACWCCWCSVADALGGGGMIPWLPRLEGSIRGSMGSAVMPCTLRSCQATPLAASKCIRHQSAWTCMTSFPLHTATRACEAWVHQM